MTKRFGALGARDTDCGGVGILSIGVSRRPADPCPGRDRGQEARRNRASLAVDPGKRRDLQHLAAKLASSSRRSPRARPGRSSANCRP